MPQPACVLHFPLTACKVLGPAPALQAAKGGAVVLQVPWPTRRWPMHVFTAGACTCLFLSSFCHLLGSYQFRNTQVLPPSPRLHPSRPPVTERLLPMRSRGAAQHPEPLTAAACVSTSCSAADCNGAYPGAHHQSQLWHMRPSAHMCYSWRSAVHCAQAIWRLDYAGIVILIVTSFVPSVHYSFLCRRWLRTLYLGVTMALGTLDCLASAEPLLDLMSRQSCVCQRARV